MKGAAGFGKADNASTATDEVSDARSESPDRSPPGLSGCRHPR